jgi:hypothetical protein
MGLLSSEAFIHQRSGSLFFWLLRGTKRGEANNYEKVISFVYLPYTKKESLRLFYALFTGALCRFVCNARYRTDWT